MLKNVSSHLKGMATGFLGNVTSKVGNLPGISGLMPSISGAQGKIAAQLLKKSPLEIPDTALGIAKSDPLQFSFTQYPLDLTNNENGHYIIFYAISNKYDNVDEALKTAGSITPSQVTEQVDTSGIGSIKKLKNLRSLKKPSGLNIKPVRAENSVLSKKATHSQATAAIALYMPPGVSVNYKMTYAASPTDAAGTVAQALKGAASADEKGKQIKAILEGARGAAGGALMKGLDEVASMLGAGEPAKLATKAFGIALNPHEEQFFEKPDFRSFSYSFEFWPKSEREADVVNNIIALFKYHMHPTLDTAAGGRFFKVPSEFEIHYAYLGGENEYLNRISRCVLSDMSVKYGPDEQFSAFRPSGNGKGSPPVSTSMTLTFQETQFITKKDILEGY
jgi:hypothetical protein